MFGLTTPYNLMTIPYRPALQKRVTDELLFDMPTIGTPHAIILGATRATALFVKAAVEAGVHQKFMVVGGKPVNQEDARYAKILDESLEKAGLPAPSRPDMRECEYGAEVLREHFDIAEDRIVTLGHDRSTNFQQNFELLACAGLKKIPAVDIYTMAATARRVIGTARQVLNSDFLIIAAHNVYPVGIDHTNWMDDAGSRFYGVSEAEKILAAPGKASKYEAAGFCRRVDLQREQTRVRCYIAEQQRAGIAAPDVAAP